ncbi:hypothetical protein MUP77_14475 [Candidatus Bathyarchaeota archaeon]|nr:hypothetical protein [Candidatus Bathyarchaeota archaeon]
MFLTIFSLLLASTATSVVFASTAVSEETVKVKFYFIDSGSCLVTHGDPYTGPPFLWQGVGIGALMLSGKADGKYFEQPAEGYSMENLNVRGCLLLKWTETDNSKHWVSVTFYSTATSKGIYYVDPVSSGSISMFSANLDDYIRFKGIYYDGSKIQFINGIAALMIIHSIYLSIERYYVVVQLLTGLQPIDPETTIQAAWSNIHVADPGFPEIPAALVFRWNVEITP